MIGKADGKLRLEVGNLEWPCISALWESLSFCSHHRPRSRDEWQHIYGTWEFVRVAPCWRGRGHLVVHIWLKLRTNERKDLISSALLYLWLSSRSLPRFRCSATKTSSIGMASLWSLFDDWRCRWWFRSRILIRAFEVGLWRWAHSCTRLWKWGIQSVNSSSCQWEREEGEEGEGGERGGWNLKAVEEVEADSSQ